MWTKRALVEKAFGELVLAGYNFDITPEEQQDAASRLEAMVAAWQTQVPLPFNFSGDPTSIDLDADSGVPMVYAQTVYCGLALRMCPSNGKQPHPDTRVAFREGWGQLLKASAFPPQQQLRNTLPRGAGNKTWRTVDNPFFPPPDTGPLQVADDGGLNLGS